MANQNDAVMLFVQDLAKTLQADPNEVIQIAQLNPEALKSAVEVFQQTQDIQQAAQAFQLSLQQLVQAAKHGAKLQYLKSLKNKCAEDEELYYFKKGGSVGCGCKKKEEGGKVTKTPEKNSSIERFKNRPRTKEEQAKIDKLSELDYLSYKSKVSESNDERTPQQKALKMKVEKKSKGSKMKLLERGSKCPKCGKVHSAGMGCSIAKFKLKYQWGGEFLLPDVEIIGKNKSKKSKGLLMREQMKIANEQYNDRPQVLKADRTAEGTQKPTDTYSKYKTFKEAYNAARKNKDMYFDFKGKVYRSYDNPNSSPKGFRDNKAEMMARYGKYLGWRKDPNMGNKSVKHTTDIKNESLGDTNILELAKINPAEPVEYNNNNLAKWLLFENWKPEDYETLANKTAAAGAATAGALGASMLAGPAMAYTTARLMPQVGRQAVMSGYRGPGSRMFSRMMGGNGNPVNGGNALQNWYWGGREGLSNPSFLLRTVNSIKEFATTPVSGGGNSGVPQFLYFKKNGGSLKHISFYLGGTNKFGIRLQSEIDAINLQNRNNAKGLFKGMVSGKIVPTLPNIGRMVSSAYNGWIDPETPYLTGIAPTTGITKAKNALEALQMVKAMKAAKTATSVPKIFKPKPISNLSPLGSRVYRDLSIESSNPRTINRMQQKDLYDLYIQEPKVFNLMKQAFKGSTLENIFDAVVTEGKLGSYNNISNTSNAAHSMFTGEGLSRSKSTLNTGMDEYTGSSWFWDK